MKYNGTIYRPPVEADTFLLPITEGCTHNSCTFCNMYQDIPFRMLDGILRNEKQRMLDALEWSIQHVNENVIKRTARVGTL